MIIELRGVEFINKGAELMLFAILDQIKPRIPEAVFVMESNSRVPITKLLKSGILIKTTIIRKGINFEPFLNRFPKKLRKILRLVLEEEVDVVLDGSGFAFGDKWGAKKAGIRLADSIQKWKIQGKKVILLPQAFGPFTDKELRVKMKLILENADLIFARDRISYNYLEELADSGSNFFLAPDFSNLLGGKSFDHQIDPEKSVAIIPNQKMMETENENDNVAYPKFLSEIIRLIQDMNFQPYFLIHESNMDKNIANMINLDLSKQIKIIQDENPIKVKGIIGDSYAVITSRFHGLVSALAQGVPCLATGWSHKYEMLFEDYHYKEGLCSVSESSEYYKEKLKMILEKPSRSNITQNLKEQAVIQKRLSVEMWEKVFNLLTS
ncbi:polysaccharide pyruvyl transferase family protein [Algoriphagus hitonicola]|uniref:Colanic acid/amylovoran biosynthesis protein n=1 Tax=Algoriphagus hitonicola TaxID=435880 RepID=A0A1I2X4N7_9BACT|nr:polysaccharide pyruvyl transferase family protein [Algoriphagus hitonicola]SFH08503.1 colanic acid/amylovoran biosynthesis protein [Algoriphagus hitonicola]